MPEALHQKIKKLLSQHFLETNRAVDIVYVEWDMRSLGDYPRIARVDVQSHQTTFKETN